MNDKKPIRDIVKDPEWQKVRQDLVGKWVSDPDYCISQLRKFLGPISKASDDKLRIVANYLVSSGFRTGRIHNTPEIKKLRSEIFLELKRRKYNQ